MKTIVVSGACSGVGKTTLAGELCELLPGAVVVKIGHGQRKEGKCGNFYPAGTRFADILRRHPQASFLVVESNSVVQQIAPDLLLFLDGPAIKPPAVPIRAAADMVSGQRVNPDSLARLAERLGVTKDVMARIAWLSGARPEPAAAIILAGGRSTRMGTDKARLEIEGRPLIADLAAQLRPHFDALMISIAQQGGTLIPGVPHVVDLKRGFGPLMGIHSALTASSCRVHFVVACDVPVIDVGLLRKLLSYAVSCDAAVPTFGDGRLEPLFAVYGRDVLPHTAAMIADGSLRVRDLLSRCRSRIVEVAASDWYVNLNEPAAYRHYVAERRRKREDP